MTGKPCPPPLWPDIEAGRAKHLLGIRKAGHTGTLDPFATGLLVLCFGEATKFAGELLEAPKAYRACVTLGITTATADAEGARWINKDSQLRRPPLAERPSNEIVSDVRFDFRLWKIGSVGCRY